MSTSAIQHVLLDIEGTTCPVSFVSQTLFPYASAQLAPFLAAHGSLAAVADLVQQVLEAWAEDPSEEAVMLRRATPQGTDPAQAVLPYLLWLIREDRKLPALKDMQGLVWEEGYRSGALVGPLYADVPAALQRWQQSGLTLSVYSSGSVRAQQLLYAHSNAGDLRSLFRHWFDTRIGSKHESSSYLRICQTLQTLPDQVLFISDSQAELQAASEAGLKVLHSCRDDCDTISPATYSPTSLPFTSISSFEAVRP